MRHGILTAILTFLLLSSSATGQETAGSYALAFSRLDHNPVTLASGGCGILGTSGISGAATLNSAVIPFSEKKADMAASYGQWNPDNSKWYNIGVTMNLKNRFGISFGTAMSSGPETELVNDEGLTGGLYKGNRLMIDLGLAYRFVDCLSAGMNLHYATERLTPSTTISAPFADVFMMMDIKGIRAAAGVRNIGPSVMSASGISYPLPTSICIAGGYGKDFDRHAVEVELQADVCLGGKNLPANDPATLSAGMSYTFRKTISVRGGYHWGGPAAIIPSYASAGLGLNFAGVHLDFAYLLSGNSLGNSFCAGIGYGF